VSPPYGTTAGTRPFACLVFSSITYDLLQVVANLPPFFVHPDTFTALDENGKTREIDALSRSS
jgi:hypothetical protein